MFFHVTLDCRNDAFDAERNVEVARILRKLAERLEAHELDLPAYMTTNTATLFDINGNDVGRATYQRR